MDVPLKRRAMIQLDHLIICLTQLVLVFDELDGFVGNWPEDIQQSLWRRWRFSGQDSKMASLNLKIMQHKTSINLILNVLQCESDIEARRSGESLYHIIQRALDENRQLRSHIRGHGLSVRHTPRSFSTVGPATSLNTPPRIENGGVSDDTFPFEDLREEEEGEEGDEFTIRNEHIAMSAGLNDTDTLKTSSILRTPRTSLDIVSSSRLSWIQDSIHMRPFENILARSSVYARARSQECDVSFTTSQSKSGLWSLLSGLSLSQISNISIIALPISLVDISNCSWYQRECPTVPLQEAAVQEGGTTFETSSSISFLEASKQGPRVAMTGRRAVSPLYKTLKYIVPDSLIPDFPSTIEVYRIAVLGKSLVGKSALATRFWGNKFERQFSTIIDCLDKSLEVDGVICRPFISDISGKDDYDVLVQESIENADGFILAYSMLDLDSFTETRALHRRITHAKEQSRSSRNGIVIAATKLDEVSERKVFEGPGYSFAANSGCDFFACSAKTGQNFDAAFMAVVRALRAKAGEGKSKEHTM